MSLYHAEVGYPEFVEDYIAVAKSIPLSYQSYSPHALKEAESDRYDDEITLPTSINFDNCYVFEVETDSNRVIKIVVRVEYDDIYDLSMAVMVGDEVKVKTIWLNERDDIHTTLDESKYDRPE